VDAAQAAFASARAAQQQALWHVQRVAWLLPADIPAARGDHQAPSRPCAVGGGALRLQWLLRAAFRTARGDRHAASTVRRERGMRAGTLARDGLKSIAASALASLTREPRVLRRSSRGMAGGGGRPARRRRRWEQWRWRCESREQRRRRRRGAALPPATHALRAVGILLGWVAASSAAAATPMGRRSPAAAGAAAQACTLVPA
jgi:hypothetical protein